MHRGNPVQGVPFDDGDRRLRALEASCLPSATA